MPEASRLILRLYGEAGALKVAETVSGRAGERGLEAPQQIFDITQRGSLAIEGPGGAAWEIYVVDDDLPSVTAHGAPERGLNG